MCMTHRDFAAFPTPHHFSLLPIVHRNFLMILSRYHDITIRCQRPRLSFEEYFHNCVQISPSDRYSSQFNHACWKITILKFSDLEGSKAPYGNYSMQINRKIRSDRQRGTHVSSLTEYHTANKDKSRTNVLRVNDATTETTPNWKSFATSVPLVYSTQHSIPNNMINLKKGGIILTTLYRFFCDRPVPYSSHNL